MSPPCITSIRRIVEFAEQFQRGVTGIERFYEIMDADVDIFDEPDAVPLGDVKGEIRFEDVSFEYPDDHNQVFQHIDLTIRPGERLALVGPSGGGKTTLCNLIPRFFDATSGHITIDGKDVRKVTLKSLRGAIGMVQQDVYLFSGTVMENILYGRPSATREEVIEAAKLAGAHEFITQLKDGYDTYVGERGVKLSGGQKQRTEHRPGIPEKPAHPDSGRGHHRPGQRERGAWCRQRLQKLAIGRTTLTIAHRLTTIQNADRILVLGSDGIEESGTHTELLAKKGVYYHLWNTAASLDRPM